MNRLSRHSGSLRGAGSTLATLLDPSGTAAMRSARLKGFLATLLVATCLSPLSPALAKVAVYTTATAAESVLDQAPYTVSADIEITVRPNRTVQKLLTLRIKVQREAAIQYVGQQQLSYIDGMESLDILEAYTEKADGQRITVDPATIITSDAASGLSLMFLRDQKIRTTIFPDIAVGDTIVLKAVFDKKKDFFPDQFADQYIFPRVAPFKDATVSLTFPKEVPVKIGVNGEELQRVITEG